MLHTVQVANLPPEIPHDTTALALVHYGKIRDIKDEMQSVVHIYKVSSSIWALVLELYAHTMPYTNSWISSLTSRMHIT